MKAGGGMKTRIIKCSLENIIAGSVQCEMWLSKIGWSSVGLYGVKYFSQSINRMEF
jgi:hypothetical protein